MEDNKRLEIATQIATALATNCDDTSPAGLLRLKEVSIKLADELIAGTA